MSINYSHQALRIIRYCHYFFGSMVGIFFILSLVSTYLFTLYRVDGHSMDPTLDDGQVMGVQRLAYRTSLPKKEDIVVLFYAGDTSVRMVKRVIGLPGETIEVEGRQWKLQPDEYFVMGDNAEHSTDSRVYGPIKGGQIIGKAMELPFIKGTSVSL